MTYTWERVHSPEQLAEAWHIRRLVFIDEQGVTEEEEIDGLDEVPTTHHVLVRDADGAPVGTARLLIDEPGLVHIGRVAVLEHLRDQGVGRILMDALEQIAAAECAADGQVRIELSAQVSAIDFYRRLGYEIAPEQYLDARILHQDAHKVITT